MFGIIISVIVLLTMGYLILKNYKPQVVLAAAGIFLMICGVWLGYGALVASDKSSGYLLVDIYNEILRMLSNRAAGLGLSIMAVGGYARYMDRMGASRATLYCACRDVCNWSNHGTVHHQCFRIGHAADGYALPNAGQPGREPFIRGSGHCHFDVD